METQSKLGLKGKISYGLGAVGKDMVYMLSASYILYYFQDIMGVSAWAMGIILLAARVFDAFNDPIMGVIVSKTKTRWGKFRPWLLIGTLTNAVILYLMFAAPPSLDAGGMVAYAAVTYILWGVTYTMMDIPYWSMIPAFTQSGKEREGLSAFARSAAGVGSAIISIVTIMTVSAIGVSLSPDAPAYKEADAKVANIQKAQADLISEMKAGLNGEHDNEVDLFVVDAQHSFDFPIQLKTEMDLLKAVRTPKMIERSQNKILELEEAIKNLKVSMAETEEKFVSMGLTHEQCQAVSANINALAQAQAELVKAKVPVDRIGFKWFSLGVAILFVLFTVIMCLCIKEKSTVDMKTASIGDMFKALIQNDQAVTIVVAIVCINTALYITSNLVIYFFKYDFSPAFWETNYSLFQTFSGGFQILAMMLLFPLLRKFMNTLKVFYTCFFMAMAGYVILLCISFTNSSNFLLLIPSAFLIMSAIGMLNVVVTIFLANTVDYGELKNNRRDEAVIFSMQTFVVKLASGLSAMIAGVILSVCHINKDALVGTKLPALSSIGLRMCMTIIPMLVLIVGMLVFKKHYILTDKKVEEIAGEIKARNSN